MKNRWRTFFVVTIASLLFVITDAPSDAARRAAKGSSYDGTWSVAIYTLRGDCGSLRAALQIAGGRVYFCGRILSSLRSCRSRRRNPSDPRQRQPVGVGFGPPVV